MRRNVAFLLYVLLLLFSGRLSSGQSVDIEFKDASLLAAWKFVDIEHPAVLDGTLYGKAVSGEPRMEFVLSSPIMASAYSHLAVLMRVRTPASGVYIKARFYWQCAGDDDYSDERCVIFNVPNESPFVQLTIPLNHPAWQGALTRIMFSPMDYAGDFWIKYIALKEKGADWSPEKAVRHRFDFGDGTTAQGWMAFGGIECLDARDGALTIRSEALGGAALYYYFPVGQRLWQTPYVKLRIGATQASRGEFQFYNRGALQHSVPFVIPKKLKPGVSYVKLREQLDPSHPYESIVLNLDVRHTGETYTIDSSELLTRQTARAVLLATWQKFFEFEENRSVRVLAKIALMVLGILGIVFCARLIFKRRAFQWAEFEQHMRRSGAVLILIIWFFLGILYVTEEWEQFWEDRRYMGGLDETGRASVILSDIQSAGREALDGDFLRFAKYCRSVIPPQTPVWFMIPPKSGLHGFATYYFYPLILFDPVTTKEARDYLIAYKQSSEDIEKFAPKDAFTVYQKLNENCIILKRKNR